MAPRRKIFEGDLLYTMNEGGIIFGHVSKLGGDFTYENGQLVKKNEVLVRWHPSHKEEILQPRLCKLHDRFLMPGQVVRLRFDNTRDSPVGICVHTKVKVCVRVLKTSKIIMNVDAKRLTHIPHEITIGKALLFNSWLGVVSSVKYEMTVVTEDKSKGVISEVDFALFRDINEPAREKYDYKLAITAYLGQEVSGSAKNLKEVRWSSKTHKMSKLIESPGNEQINLTVTDIGIEYLHVDWVYCFEKEKQFEPKSVLEKEDIKRLVLLNYNSRTDRHMLGDCFRLVVDSKDSVLDMKKWRKHVGSKMNPTIFFEGGKEGACIIMDEWGQIKSFSKQPRTDESLERMSNGFGDYDDQTASRNLETPEKAEAHFNCDEHLGVEIVAISTKALVIWQDGSIQDNVSSVELQPLHKNERLFFPQDFVMKRSNDKLEEFGMVVEAYPYKKTASVAWAKYKPRSVGRTDIELGSEIEVKISGIVRHPTFNFQICDLVMRIKNEKENVKPISRLGQVTGVKTPGCIEVKWFDGKITAEYSIDLKMIRLRNIISSRVKGYAGRT